MKCIFLQEERTDNSGSSIEQNFLLELENFNSLNEALDDMVGYIPVSFLILNRIFFLLLFSQEAQDRTDVIAFDDDDDWEKFRVGNEVTTDRNVEKVDAEVDNSEPSPDGYAEEQSSDFLSEIFDFFG